VYEGGVFLYQGMQLSAMEYSRRLAIIRWTCRTPRHSTRKGYGNARGCPGILRAPTRAEDGVLSREIKCICPFPTRPLHTVMDIKWNSQRYHGYSPLSGEHSDKELFGSQTDLSESFDIGYEIAGDAMRSPSKDKLPADPFNCTVGTSGPTTTSSRDCRRRISSISGSV
jgi:hypothetical protein